MFKAALFVMVKDQNKQKQRFGQGARVMVGDSAVGAHRAPTSPTHGHAGHSEEEMLPLTHLVCVNLCYISAFVSAL